MSFKTKMISLKDIILDAIFPNDIKCILCGKDISNHKDPFCESCKNDDIFNNGNRCKICDSEIKEGNIICDHCKTRKIYFEKCICPLNYSGNVRTTILSFKSDGSKYLAKPFAKIIAERLKNENIDFDIIIPVPSHKKTIKKRGYNPAFLLAEELSKIFNKPVKDVLRKNVVTKNQKFLNYQDRQSNLRNTIVLIDDTEIKNKNILLVDDIITTCATINTCCELLVGSKKIYACSIARQQIN